MKKLFLLLVLLFVLVGCNAADNVVNNVQTDADNFQVYRKVTVINLRSDKLLLEVEGYLSIKDSTSDELAIIIKTSPNTYKMHYVYLGAEVVYLVEQTENIETDMYHWKIRIFAITPEIVGKE